MSVKQQFEFEFYLMTKDQLDQYKGPRPIITWLNGDQKPMIDMDFLLYVDRDTRVKISILLNKFSLQCLSSGAGSRKGNEEQ